MRGSGGGVSGEPHPLLEFAKFKIKKKYNVTIYIINELTVNINFVKWFDPPPPPSPNGKNSGSAFDRDN